jgi:hypothetical protein
VPLRAAFQFGVPVTTALSGVLRSRRRPPRVMRLRGVEVEIECVGAVLEVS